MLRKAINVSTGIKYEDIKLMRTLEGRPYMPGLPDGLDTNVSHHGSWVSIAYIPLFTVVDIVSGISTTRI